MGAHYNVSLLITVLGSLCLSSHTYCDVQVVLFPRVRLCRQLLELSRMGLGGRVYAGLGVIGFPAHKYPVEAYMTSCRYVALEPP